MKEEGGKGKGKDEKNGIYINMVNQLYYLHYTLNMFKKTLSIQSNCCKSHIPDCMAVFLVGKPEVVKDGF
jgi:hypothetical protein